MKVNEIITKKDADLKKLLAELQAKQVKVRFEVSTKESNNNAEIKKLKRDIARIKTILTEREIEREEAKDEKNA